MKKIKISQHNAVQSSSQSKVQKKSPSTLTAKKKSKTLTPSNKKQQSKINKLKQPQDYIIINDSIYSANTFTQRNSYEQFLNKVKKQKQIQRKSFLIKSQINEEQSQDRSQNGLKRKKRKMFQKLSPQDLIQTMSLQQKKQMFFKLQQQIKQSSNTSLPNSKQINLSLHSPLTLYQPQSLSSQLIQSSRQKLKSQRQRQEKFQLIQQKLQNLKMQLMFKWESQIDKIHQLCTKGKISEKQRDSKIKISEKIKDHKLKILDCTKTLFQKILTEDQYEKQHNEEKQNKIQAILQSLHSFPSLQNMDENYFEKQPNINHLKLKENETFLKKNFESGPLQIFQNNSHLAFLDSFKQNQQQKEKSSRKEGQNSQYKTVDARLQERRFDKFKQIQVSSWVNLNRFEIEEPQTEQRVEKIFKDQIIQVEIPDKISLKLDLRLDQIVMGQDQYPQCQKDNQKHQIAYYLPPQKKSMKFRQQKLGQQSKSYSQTSFEQVQEVNSHKIIYYRQLVQSKDEQRDQPMDHHMQKQSFLTTTQFKVDEEISLSININKSSNTTMNKDVTNMNTNNIKEGHQLQQPLQLPTSVQQPMTQTSTSTIIAMTRTITKTTTTTIKAQQQKQKQQVQDQDDLTCKQTPQQKINIDIPLILTKDKMEAIQYQRNRIFKDNLDRHVAFQMGCIEIQPSDPSLPAPVHFTTLVDINSYIIGFYEFMMKKYLNSLVDNLNIPYGKSVVDKLYSLQSQGYVLEQSYNGMNNILSQAHFSQYQRQMMLTVRKCTQYQATHNRVVFEAFTKCINVYRPYYQLQGEVFPWIVSEKGITFYQITQENIEEVFQKSKIKVLQYCTTLSGLHPPASVRNQDQKQLLHLKCQENLAKMMKTQTIQQFQEWNIRYVNYQCLVRVMIAERLWDELVKEALQEITAQCKAEAVQIG